MKQFATQQGRYLIVLIATLGLAVPAMANRQATPATAAAKRATAATASKPRALLATTPRPTAAKPRLSWQTTWQTQATESGVTLLSRQSEQLATDGSTAERNLIFSGQTKRVVLDGAGAKTYDWWGPSVDVGALVFEPQPAGQHRVLLRAPNNTTYEALPTRTSAGANGRRAARRSVDNAGSTSRVELVQFFKGAALGKRTTYYAAYGEEGLVGADGTKQTLTHLINISTRRIVSLPYKFISIWNGTGSSTPYVMVEPLKADGKPDVGTILGISIAALKQDFAGTLADPSKWTVLLGSK